MPGVTGAQIPAPQGMWCDGGPRGGPPDPSRPLSPPGSWPNSPHPVLGRGPQGLGKAAPRPPHASPQTHSHTTAPCLGASPCQPGQGAALMPAPDGQGDQGDRTGLRGVGGWGELWAPKEEGARRGHLLGSAQPHPLRKPLPPWPVGWDPPGPEGQLRRARSPEMRGPRSSP